MVIEHPAEAEENLQKLLTQREEVALVVAFTLDPKLSLMACFLPQLE